MLPLLPCIIMLDLFFFHTLVRIVRDHPFSFQPWLHFILIQSLVVQLQSYYNQSPCWLSFFFPKSQNLKQSENQNNLKKDSGKSHFPLVRVNPFYEQFVQNSQNEDGKLGNWIYFRELIVSLEREVEILVNNLNIINFALFMVNQKCWICISFTIIIHFKLIEFLRCFLCNHIDPWTLHGSFFFLQ